MHTLAADVLLMMVYLLLLCWVVQVVVKVMQVVFFRQVKHESEPDARGMEVDP